MLAVTYETKGQEQVKKFTSLFSERLKTATGSQLFNGNIETLLIGKGRGLILLDFKVLMPPFHFIFLFGSVGALLLGSPLMTCLFAGVFVLFVYLRSKFFFYSLLKKGLRKQGYKEILRLL